MSRCVRNLFSGAVMLRANIGRLKLIFAIALAAQLQLGCQTSNSRGSEPGSSVPAAAHHDSTPNKTSAGASASLVQIFVGESGVAIRSQDGSISEDAGRRKSGR